MDVNLSARERTRAYYNSQDADQFYLRVWGGEDIHIGIYGKSDDIISASQATVRRMLQQIHLSADSKVLDIGSGYGGSARYIARTAGCRVDCLNLSSVQNERNVRLNQEQKLASRIRVQTGSFEEIPGPAGRYDCVWSQDAILHAPDKKRVFAEVRRVLKAGGDFVFTDPMQTRDAPQAAIRPLLERIHLEAMGSPELYRELGKSVGLELRSFIDLSEHLVEHYARVRAELDARTEELSEGSSLEYLEKMKAGLDLWVEAGKSGYLTWGIFHFIRADDS